MLAADYRAWYWTSSQITGVKICKAVCAACLRQSITVTGHVQHLDETFGSILKQSLLVLEVQYAVPGCIQSQFCSEQQSSGRCWELWLWGDAVWYISRGGGNGEWVFLLHLVRAAQEFDTEVWKWIFQCIFYGVLPSPEVWTEWFFFFFKLLFLIS